MPLKRKPLRKNAKRRFKRFTRVPRTNIGFPITKIVRMRYADDFTLDPSALFPIQTYSYRASSIFDPDFTGAGHQPLGRDEWNTFYSRYVVLSSKITLSFVAMSTTVPNIVGIQLSSVLPTGATITALIEQGFTNYELIQCAVNGEPSLKTLTHTYNAKKWHEVKDVKDADNLEADQGANPAEQTLFNIIVASYDGTSDTASVSGFLTIDYVVMLKDPKELVQS